MGLTEDLPQDGVNCLCRRSPNTSHAPFSPLCCLCALQYIDDPIVRLRVWATESAHPLPEPRVAFKLGSGSQCEVQLYDKARRLSREHAELVPEVTGWEIHDLGSKNGLWVDGVRTVKAMVQAGRKIQLGGLTLVAESIKFIALRALVCRLLGWDPAHQADVDEAL